MFCVQELASAELRFETSSDGEFIFILVWAIRLTSCFVYRRTFGGADERGGTDDARGG